MLHTSHGAKIKSDIGLKYYINSHGRQILLTVWDDDTCMTQSSFSLCVRYCTEISCVTKKNVSKRPHLADPSKVNCEMS